MKITYLLPDKKTMTIYKAQHIPQIDDIIRFNDNQYTYIVKQRVFVYGAISTEVAISLEYA